MGRGSKKKKGSSNNGRTGGSKGSSSSQNDVKPKVDIWHGLPGGNPYEPGTRNHKQLQKTLQLNAECLKHCKNKQLVVSMCPMLRSENPYPPDDPRCRKYYITHFHDADRYIGSTQTEDDPELDELDKQFAGLIVKLKADRKLRESTEASPSEDDVIAVKSRIVTSPPQNDLKPKASKVDGSPSEDGVILRPGFIYGTQSVGSMKLPLGVIDSPLEMIFQHTRPLNQLPLVGPLFTPHVNVTAIAKVVVKAVTNLVFPPGIGDIYEIQRYTQYKSK